MRRAVDTNVLARAFFDDGSEQSAKAAAVFRDGSVFVADTVLIETEWLLRSRMRRTRDEVSSFFGSLLAVENSEFADRTRIVHAVAAHRNGVDFADAMHLLACADCDAFLTYDFDLLRRARAVDGAIPAREP